MVSNRKASDIALCIIDGSDLQTPKGKGTAIGNLAKVVAITLLASCEQHSRNSANVLNEVLSPLIESLLADYQNKEKKKNVRD